LVGGFLNEPVNNALPISPGVQVGEISLNRYALRFDEGVCPLGPPEGSKNGSNGGVFVVIVGGVVVVISKSVRDWEMLPDFDILSLIGVVFDILSIPDRVVESGDVNEIAFASARDRAPIVLKSPALINAGTIFVRDCDSV
jgi:hypothetical protein